ncbi:MAG TPA: redoxin domain-containing protein [Ktedonobacterales bacterium]
MQPSNRQPSVGVGTAAPELEPTDWVNCQPFRLVDLRGRVTLVEFWTFDCINCQRVLPALMQWHHAYAARGLVIVGVHTPEFRHERELSNVQAAVQQYGIQYPVILDNDFDAWRAYRNRFWPTLYLVDKRGLIRYTHVGEGSYEQTRRAIEALLAEPA